MSYNQILTNDDNTVVGSAEEDPIGAFEASGAQIFTGVLISWALTALQTPLKAPDGGSEDMREVQYGFARTVSSLDCYLTNFTIPQWATALKNPGTPTGTPSATRCFSSQFNDKGTTKYKYLEFANVNSFTLQGGSNQFHRWTLNMTGKYNLPDLTAWTSKATLATDAGKDTVPILEFPDGGADPFTLDNDAADIVNVALNWDRGLISRPSGGDRSLNVNVVSKRDIIWMVTMGRDATTDNVIADFKDRYTNKDAVWTLDTGVAVLTLSDIWIEGGVPLVWYNQPGEVQTTLVGGALASAWS